MGNLAKSESVIDKKWTSPSNFKKKNPTKGAHIRVGRLWGLYSHHGIYVSDSEVYHLTGKYAIWEWKNAKPECTSLTRFLNGGSLEVREYTPEQENLKNDVNTIVANAKKMYDKLNNKGYNLLNDNCECFANSCVFIENDKIYEKVKSFWMSRQVQLVGGGVGAALFAGLLALLVKIFGKRSDSTPKQS